MTLAVGPPQHRADDVLTAPATVARRAIAAALDSLGTIEPAQGDARLYETLIALVMRRLARAAARAGGLDVEARGRGRLFDDAFDVALPERAIAAVASAIDALAPASAGAIGRIYESLIGWGIERSGGRLCLAPVARRKRTGSFYTPDGLASVVAERAVEAAISFADRDELTICDPAMGAGAFLVAAADAVVRRCGLEHADRSRIVATRLFGADSSVTAVAVAEVCLWLYAADPELSIECLRDRLLVRDSLSASADDGLPLSGERFGLVIGNPPWVAFAGRAAQPIDPERRADYARRFASWRGYPTLHGLFIERSAQLAPNGVVALLIPSPVADLDGYRAARRALTATHTPLEPLLEFGQDAFEGVTQPCFALVAVPSPTAQSSDRRWQLAERQRTVGTARAVVVPEVLAELARRTPLPAQCFRELGFQTSRRATTSLLLRAPAADATHRYPLLEGRDVRPFHVGPPRLFIDSDPERIKWAGCRLRPESDYRSVRFVIRQTAKVPIAALHTGLPFRNSLLAGFEADGLDAELLVGLLNSALYRALHLSQQRDARQATFPQVKIAHLRGLPEPPADASARECVRRLCRAANVDAPRAHAGLDSAVFDLFEVSSTARSAVIEFVASRAPELGHTGGA